MVRRSLTLLVNYLRPQWRQALLMTIVLLFNISMQLLNPQILRMFIDTTAQNGASGTLLILGTLFLLVSLANQGSAIAVDYLSVNVAWLTTNHLRRDLVAHCLSLGPEYHKTHTSGELIERIDGDVNKLSNFFSDFVIKLLSHTLFLLGILMVFYTITWYVGLIMTLYILATLALLTHFRRRTVHLWEKNRQMSAAFAGFLSERLSGTADIRANGATSYTLRRFLQQRRQWLPLYWRAESLSSWMAVSTILLLSGGVILALMLGTYLWSQQIISLGTVFLMFSYVSQFEAPVGQLQTQMQDLQQAEACLRRTHQLLATSSELRAGPGYPLPATAALSVSFQHVTFGYIPEKPILHDLTFQIEPGRVLGLIGRTGSGKTTIARLLFRLYDPQQGEILLGGVPIQQAKLPDVRARIRLVTQDVQLFRASIRDNLTFFNRAIPDARILATLAEVGLLSWYRTLPDGLDTLSGSENGGLSAGEAQLLALARAFLTEAAIVVLDEASAHLDPATECLIDNALDKLLAGRAAIIIAHRLSTIQRADDILVIEDGKMLEYGKRAALMADPSSHLSHLLQVGLEEVRA